MGAFKVSLWILVSGFSALSPLAEAGEFTPALSCHKTVLPLLRKIDDCLSRKRPFDLGPKAPSDRPPRVEGVVDGKTIFPIGQSNTPPEEVYLIESQRLGKNGFYVITESDAYFKELTIEEVRKGLFDDHLGTNGSPLEFHYLLSIPKKQSIRLTYAPGPTDGLGNLTPAYPEVMPNELYAKKKNLGIPTPDFKATDLSQSSLGGGDLPAHQALNDALAAEVKKLRVLSERIPPERYRSYEGCFKESFPLGKLRACAKIERGSKEMKKDAERAISILTKLEDAVSAARGVLSGQSDSEEASQGTASRAE